MRTLLLCALLMLGQPALVVDPAPPTPGDSAAATLPRDVLRRAIEQARAEERARTVEGPSGPALSRTADRSRLARRPFAPVRGPFVTPEALDRPLDRSSPPTHALWDVGRTATVVWTGLRAAAEDVAAWARSLGELVSAMAVLAVSWAAANRRLAIVGGLVASALILSAVALVMLRRGRSATPGKTPRRTRIERARALLGEGERRASIAKSTGLSREAVALLVATEGRPARRAANTSASGRFFRALPPGPHARIPR